MKQFYKTTDYVLWQFPLKCERIGDKIKTNYPYLSTDVKTGFRIETFEFTFKRLLYIYLNEI